MANDPKEMIEGEARNAIALERRFEEEVMASELFKQFLAKQKEFVEKIDATWKHIEEQMINYDIKSVKGDWGYLTIVDRTNFDIDYDALPRGYKKLVPDTKKIGDHYQLTGKPVKGTEPKVTKFLRKGIK